MKQIINKTILGLSLVTASYAGGMTGDTLNYKVVIDTLENQSTKGADTLAWAINMYAGYDLNKIYFYTEGSKVKNTPSETESQLVWSKAIAPYWDIQYGVGYDKTPTAHKNWAVLAFKGMTPYFFETRTSFLFGKGGNIGIRAEAETELLITQNLVLSPSFAATLYTKDDLAMETGKGLSNVTAGLRLKYKIKREFAPYIGFEYSKNFSSTNNIAPLNETNVVAGVSIWF